MKSLPWFRMWAEAVDDEKLRLLAFEDRWHFVALLCLKSQGVLDEKDIELRKRKICVKLGLDSVECETVMKRLVTVGLVNSDGNPVNWKKRQFKSDSSTSRVRAFRKRSRNVSETPSDTDTDTDTDTEKRKEGADAPTSVGVKNGSPKTPPEGLDPDAWSQWQAYRKLPPKSIHFAQKKLAAFGAQQLVAVEHSIANAYKGLYLPKQGGSSGFESAEERVKRKFLSGEI